jgi:hypothetical protein
MKELTSTKKKIVDEHFNKMLEAHNTMLKLIDDSMRNYQTKIGGNVSFFEKVKTAITFDRSKFLNLKPEDMLSYSKSWFETTKQNFQTIIQISSQEYSSLSNQIDKQFDIALNELTKVEEELKDIKDDQKKSWLQRKKDEVIDRSW